MGSWDLSRGYKVQLEGPPLLTLDPKENLEETESANLSCFGTIVPDKCQETGLELVK